MADFIPTPSQPTSTTPHKAPGTAVAALVLGLLSFIFSIFTGIAAVVCGHKALGKINRSGGILPGKGMAITGLVTGYLSIVGLFILPVLAGLAVPVIAKVQENGQISMVINDARQVYTAIELYKEQNGSYPDTLQELVDGQFLDNDALLSATSHSALTFDGGTPGGQLFYYVQPVPGDAADSTLLISDCSFSSYRGDGNVRRVVAYLDGSVRTDNFSSGPIL